MQERLAAAEGATICDIDCGAIATNAVDRKLEINLLLQCKLDWITTERKGLVRTAVAYSGLPGKPTCCRWRVRTADAPMRNFDLVIIGFPRRRVQTPDVYTL